MPGKGNSGPDRGGHVSTSGACNSGIKGMWLLDSITKFFQSDLTLGLRNSIYEG